MAALFNALTGAARPPGYHKALVAPERMRDGLLAEIEQTVEAHRAGRARADRDEDELAGGPALHPGALRGLAGRRAGGPQRARHLLPAGRRAGVSDNIRVVSVVGRFLEHSRVYGFERGEERRYFMGSADLMPRNLDTRVELLTPVEDGILRAEVEDTLERCLADDTFAWDLLPDGSWRRRTGGTRSVHRELMKNALESAAREEGDA